MTQKTNDHKWLLLAIIWFGASCYALFFSRNTSVPPFPYFNQVYHFGLFFGQTWLIIKVYLSRHQPIHMISLFITLLVWAIASEIIVIIWHPIDPHWPSDILANLIGIIIALRLGWRIQTARLNHSE